LVNNFPGPLDSASCRRFIVSGHVQGVWFRDSTRTQAIRLGISGFARNLADGTVEVLACGATESVSALETWLHEGPQRAQVDSVAEVEARKAATPGDFSIY